MQRLEALIREAEAFQDAHAQQTTREIVRSLMDLHGAGLARVVEILAASGEPGRAQIDRLAADDLVSSLLLLYGLHPTDLATRVRQALDAVRPLLHTHGSDVELLGTAGGVVRLRLQGGSETLRSAIEAAVCEAAPDLTGLEIEGGGSAPPGRLSLPLVGQV
jgi:Fe-S cluster biogenesis protein NfuA